MSEILAETRKVITEAALGRIFDTSTATFRRMRLRGEGPPFFDLRGGRSKRPIIRYYEDLAHVWFEGTRQRSKG